MREGWREVAVEDVAQVVGGGTPKSSVHSYWGGDVAWLTPKDLADRPARYTASGSRFITQEGLKNSGAKLLPKGSVLLTSRAPVGYVSVAAGPIATNQGFKSLLLHEGQLPEFWYYLLLHSTDYLRANSGGSTFQEISGGALKKLRFIIPPLREQKRIVDLMGAVDDAIEKGEKALLALRQALAARRGFLFSHGEFIDAKEVFDILMGLQRSPQRAAGDYQTPYLRSANVTEGRLLLEDVKTMSFDPHQQEKYRLRDGDVLVSEGSASVDAVGASCRYAGEINGTLCFQNTLLRFRAVPGLTTPQFVEHWCAWAYESGAFREAASGTNIKHIGMGGAATMQVAKMPFADQPALTEELDAAQHGVQLARFQLERLRILRSNLLTTLLSGEHEIPESYDELMEEAS